MRATTEPVNPPAAASAGSSSGYSSFWGSSDHGNYYPAGPSSSSSAAAAGPGGEESLLQPQQHVPPLDFMVDFSNPGDIFQFEKSFMEDNNNSPVVEESSNVQVLPPTHVDYSIFGSSQQMSQQPPSWNSGPAVDAETHQLLLQQQQQLVEGGGQHQQQQQQQLPYREIMMPVAPHPQRSMF